ncbi:DUF4352 domain-containing protein [Streptomyces sp. UC4497]
MSIYVRRAFFMAVPAVLIAVLTGCSSGGETTAKTKLSPVEASASSAKTDVGKPADKAPSVDGIPVAKPGGKAVFESGATAMTVTVRDIEYGRESNDAGSTAMGDGKQFVRLDITVENTGKAAGEFDPSGAVWESSKFAERDAATSRADDAATHVTTYKPGRSVDGEVILDVGARGGVVTFFDAEAPKAPVFRVELPKS